MIALALVVVAAMGGASPKPTAGAAAPAATTPATSATPRVSSTKSGGPRVADEHPRIAAAIRDYRALRIERVIDPLEDLLFDGDLDDATRARALYLLGLAYAQTGETETARERLLAACTLDPAVDVDVPVPRKIKSLVQAAREGGARAHAAAPRAATDSTTTTTTTTAPASPPPPTTTPTTTPTTGSTPSTAGPWPWIVASVGGVALLGGGGAGAFAWSLAAQSGASSTTQREAVRLADDANAAFTIAGVAAGIGVGVGAAGVVWAALSSPP